MTTHPHTTRLMVSMVGALALLTVACGDDDASTSNTTSPAAETTAPAPETTAPNLYTGDLKGVLEVNPGACSDGAVTGSYFQMVQPGGTPEAGPFIPNADSACADTNYTLLTFGSLDGGLFLGTAQPAPDPAFDAAGNGLADRIIAPVKFFGVDFTLATDPAGPMVSVVESAGVLTGDLSAITAYYGGGTFNQGAPKPDGTGSAAAGTMNPVDGHYMLDWTSVIVGGSFDGFTGVWHFEGRFTPES